MYLFKKLLHPERIYKRHRSGTTIQIPWVYVTMHCTGIMFGQPHTFHVKCYENQETFNVT